MNKKIGIVILNYNDFETTLHLYEMIKNYKAIDHIVIVDNYSSDNSYKCFCERESMKADLIRSKKNGGYSYGNNLGALFLIEKYNTDIILIANPDVEFNEEFVIRIASHIAEGNAHAATGLMINQNHTIETKTVKINTYIQDLLDCTLILKKIFGHSNRKHLPLNSIVKAEMLYGSLFAIDSDIFKSVHGFDDNIFLYCEERILGAKLKKIESAMIVDTSISFYHMHSISIDKSIRKINQIKQLYNSRLYYWEVYGNISQTKIAILKLFMNYGITMRKIFYE